MLPCNFEGSNIVLDKPDSATDDECLSGVPAWRGVEKKSGLYCYLFAWKPSREDIQAINNGSPIFVKIFAEPVPSHALLTMDNEGNVND